MLSLDFFNISVEFIAKAFLILFLVFYCIFSLILFRQVQLVTKALPTSAGPFLKFIAIIHIGVSVALLFIMIQLF